MDKVTPIIITGCPRSGTGILAGIFEICGCGGGVVNSMYENLEIQQRIIKPCLHLIDGDVEGQYPIAPSPYDKAVSLEWSGRMEHLLTCQGVDISKPWYYKDSRSLLLWPVWFYSYPKAKWVIVRRNTEDIIKSCNKTGWMTAFKKKELLNALAMTSEQQGWHWLINEYKYKIMEMYLHPINIREVWLERVCLGDFTEIKQIIEWCDLPWREDLVLDYITKKIKVL